MDNIVYILTIFTVIFVWLNISKKETKNYYIKMFDTFKIYIVLGLIIMFLLFRIIFLFEKIREYHQKNIQ